jgi:hypothetical protein
VIEIAALLLAEIIEPRVVTRTGAALWRTICRYRTISVTR